MVTHESFVCGREVLLTMCIRQHTAGMSFVILMYFKPYVKQSVRVLPPKHGR
jgi:hypothetical protein